MSSTPKKILVFILIMVVLLFTIISDHGVFNIDHLAYVVALGIDVGQNNKLKLSFQLSVPGRIF